MNGLVKYQPYQPGSPLHHFAVPEPPVKQATTHLVNFRGDPRDWGTLFLALFGFSHKTIAEHQGISIGRVAYRLKKFNSTRPAYERISVQDFRNGRTPIAQMVIERCGRPAKQMLVPAVAQQALTNGNGHQQVAKSDAIDV